MTDESYVIIAALARPSWQDTRRVAKEAPQPVEALDWPRCIPQRRNPEDDMPGGSGPLGDYSGGIASEAPVDSVP